MNKVLYIIIMASAICMTICSCSEHFSRRLYYDDTDSITLRRAINSYVSWFRRLPKTSEEFIHFIESHPGWKEYPNPEPLKPKSDLRIIKSRNTKYTITDTSFVIRYEKGRKTIGCTYLHNQMRWIPLELSLDIACTNHEGHPVFEQLEELSRLNDSLDSVLHTLDRKIIMNGMGILWTDMSYNRYDGLMVYSLDSLTQGRSFSNEAFICISGLCDSYMESHQEIESLYFMFPYFY